MWLQGVTISNDGATIMKLLEIVHPAAKTLVDISLSQDAEVSARLSHTVWQLHTDTTHRCGRQAMQMSVIVASDKLNLKS